jgi:CoA:oxalate CoA-transferase
MAPPLEGITVLELCHAIAGPQCAQILADHGANVIKIEPPEGERAREALPWTGDESLYFACHNRGKRSISIDLKQPGGTDLLLELCEQADVIVTNYGAEVPARLGWSYEVVAKRNPKLVYAHITGFGASGPHRNDRAYDGIIQAMSGVPDLTGSADGPPLLAGTFVADHISAYQAAMAILFALLSRTNTGQGAYLDIAMFDAYFATLAHDVGEAIAGIPRARSGNKVSTAFSDVFATSDGAVFIAPLGEQTWRRFCSCIGHPEWPGTVSYADSLGPMRASLEQGFAEWAVARTTEKALSELIGAAVPCGPVRSVSEAVVAAQEAGRGMVQRVTTPKGQVVDVPGAPVQYGLAEGGRSARIPGLGEDTATVLREFGFSPERIEELAADNVARSFRSQ